MKNIIQTLCMGLVWAGVFVSLLKTVGVSNAWEPESFVLLAIAVRLIWGDFK